MRFFQILLLGLGLFSSATIRADTGTITTNSIAEAEKLFGLEFNDTERAMMLDALKARVSEYEKNRKIEIPYDTFPAVIFNPLPHGFKLPTDTKAPRWNPIPKKVKRPANLETVAFWTIPQLAALIKSRQVSSVELTTMYLDRIKKHGPKLECVVTLTEELALAQARRADAEIAKGKYRGPLHGIPYGAKDLLATKGIKTTWGSVPYKDQVFDHDAAVIRKLEEAGAVLVAKTTMGELAWGEVWFGGMTRNPWKIENGSSGSSAGSAAGVSAGLFPFAIGSETHGSIISPAAVCGVTGLRPTYGRVSRAGCMSLSWTMDKLGPLCRTAEDSAIVLKAISGIDEGDPTTYDVPFHFQPKVDWKKLRIGYLKNDFDRKKNNTNDLATLRELEELGAQLVPIQLPTNLQASLGFILSTEGAAFFDELTRSNRDDLMVRQIANAWPNVFRGRRFVPAVEYLQAQRIRTLLIQDMHKIMQNVDLYVAPWDTGDNMLFTNLTGHPSVGIPNGFHNGLPTAISFVGQLFNERAMLAVVKAYQDATDFHLQQPPAFAVK